MTDPRPDEPYINHDDPHDAVIERHHHDLDQRERFASAPHPPAGARVSVPPPADSHSSTGCASDGRRRTEAADERRARAVLYPRLASGTVDPPVPARCARSFLPFDLEL